MKKIKLILPILLILFVPTMAFAKGLDFSVNVPTASINVETPKAQVNVEIPEKDGDYPDPADPSVRVRVHVFKGKEALAAPATNCTDPDSNSVTDWAGWKLPLGTWTYSLNTASAPSSVGAGNFANIAGNGFSLWSGATGGKVNFSRVGDNTKTKNSLDYQNIIAWGRVSGSALGVTYIRYYTSSRVAVDVDTIFNNRIVWSWTPYSPGTCGVANTYDIQAVLTHEQGHWMGLDDEYSTSYKNNTMYGYGTKGNIKADTITTGDRLGITAIYH